MISRGDYQNLEDAEEQFSTEIHSKVTWDHIQNLDQFFSNIYYFHQQHGFYVTFIEFLLQILKFFFIIWIASVLTELCFTGFIIIIDKKINFKIFYQPIIFQSQNSFTIIIIVISYLLLGLFIINSVPKLHQFYSISKFYRDALKIRDEVIPDKTWHEILKALIDVQKELPLCVHKPMLNELDIYHRILRRQNYLIAMLNKDKFPTEVCLPLLGNFMIVTKYYLDSIKFMLFKFPFKCPFGDHWQLRSEYKKLNCRTQLIEKLNQIFLIMGLTQLLISPICFFYLLITKACTYGHSFKINPSHSMNREITPYGRVFLAHFNELPHEFAYRISKAYPSANEYLDSFISKIHVAIARLFRFLSGGIIIIGFLISMFENSFLLVNHVLTIAAAVTFIYAISLKIIPDESVVVSPRLLLLDVLQYAHYIPDHWQDRAHTRQVFREFSNLFQPKIVDISKELFSCFWTPLIFLFWMPKYSSAIVDFLRNFTIDMHGVGDICSYAQSDIGKHGSQAWAVSVNTGDVRNQSRTVPKSTDGGLRPAWVRSENRDDDTRVESRADCCLKHGKVELSLVNFFTNNPDCPLNGQTRKFIDELKSIETSRRYHQRNIGAVSFQSTLTGTSGDQLHLKNASRVVGPIDSYAIDNYFHNASIPSMLLSHNSMMVDNYKSHHESSLARSDINVSIHTLHVIHERRRMGLAGMVSEQPISEAEEDSSYQQPRQRSPTNNEIATQIHSEIDNNALDLPSLPVP